MLPDDNVKLRGAGRAATSKPSGSHGRGEQSRSTERDGGSGGLAVAAVGGQRGTLYDSFELNAMVVRLNRLLLNGGGAGGSGEARHPRKAAGSWLAAPKVLFRKIKSAFLGGRRGDD
ncbi:hypothetical protein BAE44_0005231 [Dichanthelium oligosanthes]|uniref:Uncharacterized protein n=1 Tax=Dichanthelium oligosanthes TaxID=888268 RepID=A0A1E5W8S5_9POAL|nr:hypothetical protein BAE44_0005231 [Dichanthelium oligosanthes]